MALPSAWETKKNVESRLKEEHEQFISEQVKYLQNEIEKCMQYKRGDAIRPPERLEPETIQTLSSAGYVVHCPVNKNERCTVSWEKDIKKTCKWSWSYD